MCVRTWAWLKWAIWSGSCRESGIWVETAQPAKPRLSSANQMPRSDVTQPHPANQTLRHDRNQPYSAHNTSTRPITVCLLFSTSVISSLWGTLFYYLRGGDLIKSHPSVVPRVCRLSKWWSFIQTQLSLDLSTLTNFLKQLLISADVFKASVWAVSCGLDAPFKT